MVWSFLKAISAASFRRSPQTQYLQPFIHRFATTTPAAGPLPPRPKLPDHELYHVFLRGSGPGGQKINKTSSAVQMTHLPTGTVVKSQATRSRSQNYKIARQILAEKIELQVQGDESYAAKKKERASARQKSREKKAKRKYRALVEATGAQVEERDESGGEPREIKKQTEAVGAVTGGGQTGEHDTVTT